MTVKTKENIWDFDFEKEINEDVLDLDVDEVPYWVQMWTAALRVGNGEFAPSDCGKIADTGIEVLRNRVPFLSPLSMGKVVNAVEKTYQWHIEREATHTQAYEKTREWIESDKVRGGYKIKRVCRRVLDDLHLKCRSVNPFNNLSNYEK